MFRPTIRGSEAASVPTRLAVSAPAAGWFVAICLGVLAGDPVGGRISGAEPGFAQDERNYAVFEAVFLQRNNAAIGRAVVVDNNDANAAVITTSNMSSTVGSGGRLLYGNYGADDIGWEVGYLGIAGMSSAREATSAAGALQAPGNTFATQTGLNSGVLARVTDNTSVNSIELNFVFHEYDGGYNRRSGRPAQRCEGYDGGLLDWIVGFRWAGLDDAAMLGITPLDAPASSYGVTTSSNLFAGQVGTRGRMAFEGWAIEGTMKVGIAGTMLSQSQKMYDTFSPTPFRAPLSNGTDGMGMIADMNLSAVYRLSDVWGLRVGYNLLWFTGVALAPDQWDFTPSETAGTAIHGTGSLFLGGGNLGLEARW